MNTHKRLLKAAGVLCVGMGLVHAVIGFVPSWSLYFGAPEALVRSYSLLVAASLLISGLLVLAGLYGLSGAGQIRRLPALRPVLLVISLIFLVRGLFLLPELLMAGGWLDIGIPVHGRYLIFSAGSLGLGLAFGRGTLGLAPREKPGYVKTGRQTPNPL